MVDAIRPGFWDEVCRLPIGIVCATISRRSASMQTIVKTKVVYDWLPRVAHMRDGR